jgi:predicted metalloendopeptidase
MTHGFDDQGSKFDGKGNMKNWWKESDRKHFDKKGQLLLEQYGRYEVEGGLKVNGDLTLGENIADLGGLVIAWDAYQKHLKKEGRKIIGGFTPEERFFLGFAQQERELRRPESVRTQILTDPHSPAEFRINGPFANFEPFYQFYNLKKTDKLYLEQKKRSEIW